MVASLDAPEEDGDAGEHEGDDYQRVQGLGEDGAAEKEQADAAEDDGRRDPGLVRPLEIGLLHPQDDEPQHRQEVERVARHAVEGQQLAEFADRHVGRRQQAVEHQRVDRCEEQARVFVREHAVQFPREAVS